MLTKIKGIIKSSENFILNLLLFLFPTQLAFHFWPKEAFVFGIRVDYLSPAIYLTDILSVVLLCLWFYFRKTEFLKTLKKYKKVFYIFIALAVVNTFFSTFPTLSFFRWFKYLEFVVLALYFSKKNFSIKPLYFSAIFFSLIGILQFATGGTLGGLMYFLGERTFTVSYPGIALVAIAGREFLRSYSTFAHPNSMAGYLFALLLFLILHKDFKNLKYKTLGFGLITFGALLTFSLSAIISFAICIFFFKSLKKLNEEGVFVVVAIMVFLSITQIFIGQSNLNLGYLKSSNIAERVRLAELSGKMILQKPFTGVGLNTLIPNIPNFQTRQFHIWVLQPVHNVALLLFSELGIFGLVIFIYLIQKILLIGIKTKKFFLIIPLIFILITGLTDHYWLTLQQNNLFLILLISHFI